MKRPQFKDYQGKDEPIYHIHLESYAEHAESRIKQLEEINKELVNRLNQNNENLKAIHPAEDLQSGKELIINMIIYNEYLIEKATK